MKRVKTYEELSRPLKPGSLPAIYWGAFSRAARLVAPLSEGMTIGYRFGFDSGPMLDYVYRNEAHGHLGIGVLLDRIYLNTVGWRGIRQRKKHLQQLLREAIGRVRGISDSVHIADLAAGPGRYLLEVLAELPGDCLSATLRDWDTTGLKQGRALAESKGLTHVYFEQADAFDPQAIVGLKPKPHIVIVSGLYELFADNTLIKRSLTGISQLLSKGGILIYTNQPTHPQLELIARCLPNREGKPWVMRLRSQQEMDALVAEAGFTIKQQRVDRWGIFTVTLAVKAY